MLNEFNDNEEILLSEFLNAYIIFSEKRHPKLENATTMFLGGKEAKHNPKFIR